MQPLRLLLIGALLLPATVAQARTWDGRVLVGAGAGGFTGADMRRVSDAAGVWELRVGVDTHTPVNLEVAYSGMAQRIHLAATDDTTLVSNGVAGTVRLEVAAGELVPYTFLGIGWRRYDVLTSVAPAMSDSDSCAEAPMGAGALVRHDAFLIDIRLTFNWTLGSTLIPAGAGRFNSLDTWLVTVAGGWQW